MPIVCHELCLPHFCEGINHFNPLEILQQKLSVKKWKEKFIEVRFKICIPNVSYGNIFSLNHFNQEFKLINVFYNRMRHLYTIFFSSLWKNSQDLMLQVMKAIMLNDKEKFFLKKCYNYVKPVPPQKLPYCEKYRYNKWNISISDLASLAMLL